MHRLDVLSSKKAYLYPAMFAWWTEARILTSFKAFSFSFAESFCILTYKKIGKFKITVLEKINSLRATYFFEGVGLLIRFSVDFVNL